MLNKANPATGEIFIAVTDHCLLHVIKLSNALVIPEESCYKPAHGCILTRFLRNDSLLNPTGQTGTKKAKAHAKTQRRKVTAKFFSFAFLCATLAALRLCVNAFQ
jgi:hypothetical protein